MGALENTRKVLETKLKSLPSSPYIAWPNIKSAPGPSSNYTSYLRPTLLMANTELYTLNDVERIPGIFQVDIFGQLNRGVQQVYTLADEIKDWFETNRVYTESNTTVHLQGISYGQAEVQEGWYRMFIEISFLTYN